MELTFQQVLKGTELNRVNVRDETRENSDNENKQVMTEAEFNLLFGWKAYILKQK